MKKAVKGCCLALIGIVLGTNAKAQEIINPPVYAPWHISASLGMQSTEYVFDAHRTTAVGRLAFQYMPIEHIGLELGVQSGNTMRFIADEETVYSLGGVGIEGTIKPMIDVLVAAKTPLLSPSIPLFASVKAGIAYRQLQMDRESLNELEQWKPELQAGLGYQVNQRLNMNVMYQYIAGARPKIQSHAETDSGHISNIPNQRAVFLELTYALG